MKPIIDFLEHRLGLLSDFESLANNPVRGGVRLRHVFAPVMLYLVIQEIVLGLALAVYYSPSATDAWASTAYIQDQVTMGWFVRGLHYHSASALVIVAGLWLAVTAFTRAFRQPRELTWVAILLLVLLCLAAGLTGNPLPWDLQGYWGIQVELGIAEQTPGGAIIRRLIQGGSEAGNLTILRLYVIHAFLLPVGFLLLLGLVIKQLALHGPPPPHDMSEREADRSAVPYFPAQAFLDVLVMVAVMVVLVGLTVVTHGAELFGPADPTQNYQARPEWYFMFLYKLRMYFEGPMEPVATVVIPGAAGVFLLSLPLLDRFGGKSGRMAVTGGVGFLLTAVVVLTVVAIRADQHDEEFQKATEAAHKSARLARTYAKLGVVPLGGPAVFFNDPQYKVRQLYKEQCQNCHMANGEGGEEAPDLTDYSSRAWLKELIRDPNAPRFFGKTDHKGDMEAYPEKDLPNEQLDAVVEYLASLMGDPDASLDPNGVAKGKTLWEDELDCNSCHEVKPGVEGSAPNLFEHGSKNWVARVIRDSSKPDLFGTSGKMPKFEGKLSDQEIDDLASFVVGQRALKAE